MNSVLVTGATDGIGRETARQLLRRGLRVLVHGRSESKAVRQTKALTEELPSARAEAVWGDLSDMQQVVALARQVSRLAPVLDVLINNAGVFEKRRKLTGDGLESTMAVNHFAPFLLTHHLGAALSEAPAGRVVTVSSIAHQSGHIDLEDLTFAAVYGGYAAYAASKLANILFMRVLAQRLSETHVTANSLHPGVIATKLLRAGFGAGGASVDQGARTSVFLACSEQVARVSGGYFVDCRQVEPSREARNDRLAAGLWDATERLLARFL